jgi:hypothetical protein
LEYHPFGSCKICQYIIGITLLGWISSIFFQFTPSPSFLRKCV